MNIETATALLALLMVTATCVLLYLRRQRLYADLSARLDALGMWRDVEIGQSAPGESVCFNQRTAQIANAIGAQTFETVAAEALALSGAERSYVPVHKKGGTFAYETLIARAPAAVRLYMSQEMRDLISGVVGERVLPTPINDQSSLSLLVYDRPGDHIDWHYDHNFYRGRHFTVLLPIVNCGQKPGSFSSTRFQVKRGDSIIEFATPPNALLLFEGARVLHRATPLLEGERRIVLSMTYCTDPHSSIWQGLGRRIKDSAFFGVRALWT